MNSSFYITGKYMVGTTCFSVEDEKRKETLGDYNGNRKISIRMYYPVEKESIEGKKKASVFSEKKKKALCKAYHIKKMNAEMNSADYYENVPVSTNEKFPLILFSHGYNSYVEANTYLCCDLASHGYIVASVGHAFEAIENDYEDGSFDLYDKKINKMMYTSIFGAIRAQSKLLKKKLTSEEALAEFDAFQNKYTPYIKKRVPEWVEDMKYALEKIKIRYADYIDLRNGVGVSGHSLGGCVAYYLCRYYDEFACGINIDGGLFGEYPEKTMERPFCQISCMENVNTATRTLLNTTAPVWQVTFSKMKHNGFTDAKFYVPLKSLVGKMDSIEMFQNLSYCHYTFFDKYLKGMDTELSGLGTEGITYVKVNTKS
ncbi:MAG: hypothetical protein ACI39R_01570 [Lachnospiraceae bacterium]